MKEAEPEMNMQNSPLDEFGKFFVTNLLDRGVDAMEAILGHSNRAPEPGPIQRQFAQFSTEDRDILRQLVRQALLSAVHDFLFALEEEANLRGNIKLTINGMAVTELRGCLDFSFTAQNLSFSPLSASIFLKIPQAGFLETQS